MIASTATTRRPGSPDSSAIGVPKAQEGFGPLLGGGLAHLLRLRRPGSPDSSAIGVPKAQEGFGLLLGGGLAHLLRLRRPDSRAIRATHSCDSSATSATRSRRGRLIGVNRGFTLVELLVAITIISIMAGVAMVAVGRTREEARIAKTKATIAKLDLLIQQRYESYQTRRVPVNLSGLTKRQAAEVQYKLLLDLMRMEMPERFNDVTKPPITVHGKSLKRPALNLLYVQRNNTKPPKPANTQAKLLYAVVMSEPENAQLFASDEIADIDKDGWPVFVDGWGRPIYWLRWAPGFTIENKLSEIQTKDYSKSPDPFDPHRTNAIAFHLIPLIYSGGPSGKLGDNGDWNFDINCGDDVVFDGNPFADPTIGQALDAHGDGYNHTDNIHNHLIEQR